MLFLVKGDREYARVRRRGRFSIPADCARSPRHFEAAVNLAKKMLMDQLTREGFRYVDAAWEVRGPLPHLGEPTDDAPDPGPLADLPEITNLGHYDQVAMEQYEAAEKARAAWSNRQPTDLVDYRVIGSFDAPVPAQYRAHIGEPARGMGWQYSKG